ncbi:MAG: phosphotransferase [Anaerolineaceae bacterium]|nr:phosphotransferase [Anaerolineaceae bacterium]
MTNNDSVITNLDQVTPGWLTAVLHQSGALSTGCVTDVTASDGRGNWSQNGRLTLTYSPEAQGECPTQLFLKLVSTDLGDGEFFLPAEVTYYTRDYIDVPDAPLVRCYHAAYDPTQHRYHLLLDDLSATHQAGYDKVPNLTHGQALAEALASLHARWWGPARLGEIGAAVHDATHLQRFVAIGAPGLPHVLEQFGSKLKPHWPEQIGRIFAQLPGKLAARAGDRTHFTLLHGDANPGNMLVPKDGGERPLYLIDQQPFDWSITTWAGAFDLAYVMALYWPTDLRRTLEIPVLRHYQLQLAARGVADYAWAQLHADYRLCVALMVPVAVEYMRDGGDPDWNDFRFGLVQRTLTAFEDLDCDELLD